MKTGLQNSMKESNMVQLFSKKYLENIANVFKTLYRDEDLCDVTLCCRGGTLKAHRLILAASSPYFYRIFREHKAQTPVVILHGITIRQLQNLLDLIYKGNADIEPEELDDLYSLAKELEINGVLDIDKSSSNGQTGFLSMDSAHNIDTRYKGHKRVAVDFALQEKTAKFCKIEPKTPRNSIDKKHAEELPPRVVMSPSDLNLQRKIPIVKTELQVNGFNPPNKVNSSGNSSVKPSNGDTPENGSPKLTAWARKQRKFQCELCPSSFKRSSHLTRHQLVHTGERPYACDQCDKAFSRHDKLKHHIKKAHEEPYVDHTMTGYYPHSFEELPRPQNKPKQQQQTPTMSPPKVPKVEPESTPDDALFTISHITSVLEDSFEGPKKGRGRPRKYPPVPVQIPTVKRGRGRPRLTPSQKDEQYDLTNLPFGDLEFLTRPLQNQSEQTDPGSLLEPYVEIQTNDSEKNTNENSFEAEENSLHLNESVEFGDVSSTFENSVNISKINSNIISNMTNNGLEITSTSSGENVLSKQVLNDIENKIAKIGECTISVAN